MHKEITEQFEELGIEPSSEILDKCVEICLTHGLSDPVEFVEQWVAYSISNLNGAEPTIPFLIEFERKELANIKKELKSKPKTVKSELNSYCKDSSEALVDFYNVNPIALYSDVNINDNTNEQTTACNEDDKTFVNNDICVTPKAIKTIIPRTPLSQNQEYKFSPASYSPVCGTPRTSILNSGKIVYTFGHSNLINETTWSAKKAITIKIKNLSQYEGEPLSNNSKFLFDNILDKINLFADNIFERGKELCKKHFGPNTIDYDLQHPDILNSDTFNTIGTIVCEHEGVLDKNSTFLVGSDDMRLRKVHLNFNKAKPFGIFPGQTVLVSGTNPHGDALMVEEFFVERNLQLPEIPKVDEPINFVFACGPYTNSSDLVYEPLTNLIAYCKENKPHVLILVGPFMDTDHSMMNGTVIAESFESYYLKIITGIIEEMENDITICIIASNRDANADMVYPTPPINLRRNFSNVHMLPDPCIVDVNGIQIGLTATDIFEHLLNNELILSAGDKVKRIVNYLFHQGSFYPLNPPADGVCFDSGLASKFARIEKVPHVLVLPSSHKQFIRDVNGCLVINPGRLAPVDIGTFGRIVIHSTEKKEKPIEYMACQIRRV
ncbi:DNA polymerase alpha subunit B [Condylostylus longicornis]|uniref:DNA polymerase alpha subunit B n=1 Tax=Condylostylus longicornis TaxID=2530218 RepID=UPI00244E3EE0|nr:DNA polymerase alpha subunit B [Condylostylus longicornis]